MLCAYFDGSMSRIGGYEPWRSWNTVDIMQKINMNCFDTVLIVVIYYSYTNGSHEGFAEFCVIEVFKFSVIL